MSLFKKYREKEALESMELPKGWREQLDSQMEAALTHIEVEDEPKCGVASTYPNYDWPLLKFDSYGHVQNSAFSLPAHQRPYLSNVTSTHEGDEYIVADDHRFDEETLTARVMEKVEAVLKELRIDVKTLSDQIDDVWVALEDE